VDKVFGLTKLSKKCFCKSSHRKIFVKNTVLEPQVLKVALRGLGNIWRFVLRVGTFAVAFRQNRPAAATIGSNTSSESTGSTKMAERNQSRIDKISVKV
jgi:hypothetical protein